MNDYKTNTNNVHVSKIKKTKNVATVSKWIGKAAGITGALLKNLPGALTELVGTALETASAITEDKLSDKIEKLEQPKNEPNPSGFCFFHFLLKILLLFLLLYLACSLLAQPKETHM